jgi:uncharacterized protein (TIGR02646 family)
MKYITKGQEPIIFTEWKNLENDDWAPTYEALQGDEKRAVINALKEEQGYICCYCERRIETNDFHVEHLKPQGENLFPENQLDYDNLLCSCQRDVQRGEPLHCGNSKGSWHDEELLVSPLSLDCEAQFKYTFDGYIEPAIDNDIAASTTIDRLKLKIDKLNTLRKKAIEPFIDDELTETDLNNFTRGYLIDKAENEGKFNEFYTTIKYLFDN